MNNRVILVYPSYPGERQVPSRPPLGILTVAAPLKSQGVEVCLLDERIESNFDARLSAELKNDPICVGISSMSGSHIKGSLRISNLVKRHSRAPVVWGGVHASLAPEATVRHELIDIVVRDDGEETFSQLVTALKNKEPNLAAIRGIGFKQNDSVILTEPAEPANIENLPLIPFELIDLNKYDTRNHWTAGEKVLPIETSRGCPFICTFCTESVRKKKWRALPAQRVINDIRQYILKYGIKNFDFIDDNFFGVKNRGREIFTALIDEKLNINWYSNLRLDIMAHEDYKFNKLIEDSGCRLITFGAESGSERILKMINKKITINEITDANRKLRNFPAIDAHFVLILGFPTETPAEIIKTLLLSIKLLLENKRAFCSLPFLIPTPGTVISRQCWQTDTDMLSLEENAEIFDFGVLRHPPWIKRPPWISRKTFFTIICCTPILWLIRRTNQYNTPCWLNLIYRSFLGFFRILLSIIQKND